MFLKKVSQEYIQKYLLKEYDIIYVAPGCALDIINNNIDKILNK